MGLHAGMWSAGGNATARFWAVILWDVLSGAGGNFRLRPGDRGTGRKCFVALRGEVRAQLPDAGAESAFDLDHRAAERFGDRRELQAVLEPRERVRAISVSKLVRQAG